MLPRASRGDVESAPGPVVILVGFVFNSFFCKAKIVLFPYGSNETWKLYAPSVIVQK